jgi:CRISPR-associated protein Cas2
MLILVTYDVNIETPAGKKRLRQVAKQCENWGQRVQNSVFECLLDSAQMVTLKNRLEKIIDPEKDSLRFYHLGDDWRGRIEHYGARKSLDLEGTLLV